MIFKIFILFILLGGGGSLNYFVSVIKLTDKFIIVYLFKKFDYTNIKQGTGHYNNDAISLKLIICIIFHIRTYIYKIKQRIK